jgi:DNA-binding response OmpR family regulator
VTRSVEGSEQTAAGEGHLAGPLSRAGRCAKDVSVLLVEDDDSLREAVVRGLTRAGFRVAGAANGREALELARLSPPDAVVLDVLLTDSGGLGVAAEMRSREDLRSVPILFITALAPAVVRDSLFPAPVLYKPFTYLQLVASVRSLVQQR